MPYGPSQIARMDVVVQPNIVVVELNIVVVHTLNIVAAPPLPALAQDFS